MIIIIRKNFYFDNIDKISKVIKIYLATKKQLEYLCVTYKVYYESYY